MFGEGGARALSFIAGPVAVSGMFVAHFEFVVVLGGFHEKATFDVE